ncbi:MAG TPA: flagellar basal body protein, partial [bacterium]|nr:flagellar basal body protein [bacterium]
MTVQSIFMGLTGLTAMGHNIDVIGNNIANVNTVGFRASRPTFNDIFYQTLFNGSGATGNLGGINPP